MITTVRTALKDRTVDLPARSDALAMHLLTRAVAKRFARIVRRELTTAELASVNRLNKTPEYIEACATHDLCDANEFMIEAWEVTTGTRLRFDDEDVAWAVTCDAWNLARSADFAL